MLIKSELNDKDFKKISDFVYKKVGLNIKDNKKYLVESRLSSLIGSFFNSFTELVEHIYKFPEDSITQDIINRLTTNFTYFFREPIHFKFLKWYLQNKGKREKEIRIWSAACSSGEEPYTIAITSHEAMNIYNYDFKILATDISTKVLVRAYSGLYEGEKIRKYVPPNLIAKYFDYNINNDMYLVKKSVKDLIAFRKFNLKSNPYPFKRQFDIVFLRNVMIYFANPEKELLLNNMYNHIKEGGYLIIGLGESLIGVKHPFKLTKYSIYQKV
ncbi:MAG TPA: protein-glutamate O-methyltransferase CheR [Spirochaetota bacterium]|nr:protein-glutamate O-methyltransferase CheR [Spirochaetota bacterium]HOM37752.1 protein-glutamate O-methyltransferase CheR [Spirochaetota bacterium]HPQ49371.1 protein-glutamate O-methyltransferase CheR [Spirochaetota bacterium]